MEQAWFIQLIITIYFSTRVEGKQNAITRDTEVRTLLPVFRSSTSLCAKSTN